MSTNGRGGGPEDLEFAGCDLCGADNRRLLFWNNDLELGIPGVFGVSECRNCGHRFTSPRPVPAALARYYPPSYGPYEARDPSRSNNALDVFYDVAFASPLLRLLRSRPKGRILDYGTGGGSFLRSMKDAGWDAYGLDFSSVAVARARSLGLNVSQSDIQDAGFEDGFFDVCTMFHVLEHLPSPTAVLREINRTLKPGGLLLISIPNAASAEAKLFGRYWFGWNVPRHLQHFTPRTATRLLSRCSFDVRHIFYDSSHVWLQTTLTWIVGKKHGRILRGPLSPFLIGLSFLAMCARTSSVIHIVAEKI